MAKAGVYKIECSGNGKFYIGSSRVSLSERMLNHKIRLRKGTHDNKKMQAAWNKYGEDSFLFSEVETCSPEDAYAREQFHMDSLSPFFNNTKIAYPFPRIGQHRGMSAYIANTYNSIIDCLIRCNELKSFCEWTLPVRMFFGLQRPNGVSQEVRKKMSDGRTGISVNKGVPKLESWKALVSKKRREYVEKLKAAGEWPPSFYNRCKA